MKLQTISKFGIEEETLSAVAAAEKVPVEQLAEAVEAGSVVVLGSPSGPAKPLGIGKGLRTKVNANIGTSPDFPDLEAELKKLKAALISGADTVMDLSTGGDLDEIRRRIREECDVVMGTVPIYQAIIEAEERHGSIDELDPDHLFEVIERHCADGIDFLTLHCGVTRETIAALRRDERIGGIVSRGGSFLAHWMEVTGKENPLYERYDELLAILKRYHTAISLGDGLRPGAIADGTDAGQVAETVVLGDLVLRARKAGVQAFVEGPGHMPMDQIAGNVMLQKRLCHDAPFYVLGPLVTDIAPGYDHITAAIGGAICAAAGADYLCYVTPAEHLGLPDIDDVVQGVMSARIAAHAADIVKGVPGAADWDMRMSQARRQLDWDQMRELAIDPGRVVEVRGERGTLDPKACSMCGKFCSIRLSMSLK